MTDIQSIPVERLHPHPENSRLQLREDVLERLTAEIQRSGFRPEHAVLVRPYTDGWQLVSGHHRHEAARRVGLTEIPAWVRDMDDDEAFMQLVLCNTQGELSRIEYAVHAYRATSRGGPGRGNKGGLSDYAQQIGAERQRVSERYNVGELVEKCRMSGSFPLLIERDPYSQLIELSKAPTSVQVTLVDHMLAGQWTVTDSQYIVRQLREFNIPPEWQSWLPPAAVMQRLLDDQRFDAGKVAKIIRAADNTLKWIADNAAQIDAEEFDNWLHRQGQSSWDPRKIDAWLVDLIGRVRERQLTPEIREGDFREALADLPDGSVDLILTDPPYGDAAVTSYEQVAEFASRKLKPGGSLICYAGQSTLPEVLGAMSQHLRYWWTLKLDHNHGGQQLPGKWVMVEWKPLVWYVRDHRGSQSYIADGLRGTKPDKDAHEWAQGIDEVFALIEQLTDPDGLVVDPFAGSGSFGKAALSLGRRFIGADLEPGSKTGQVIQ